MASPSSHRSMPSMDGGGPTVTPPPTPNSQSNIHRSTSDCTADELTRLLHRLPPSLSLLTTCRAPPATSLPSVSLYEDNRERLLSAATGLGFFQLTEHDVPSRLADSAESDSVSLFKLTKEQKEACLPKSWPLGYDGEVAETRSFCLDVHRSRESTQLTLSSLSQFALALEKVGLKVVEMLASAVGFGNPLGDNPTRFCSLMWVYEGVHGDDNCNPVVSSRFYPHVVGLMYQLRNHKCSLLADSGWVSVSPRVDSVLVTIGDIAQVWSNGKLKKVRGRPVACSEEGDDSQCLTMALLLTLPLDARVFPLLPKADIGNKDEEHGEAKEEEEGERRVFRSFSFKDYAWRVYHERILFKDPLDKYRNRA